MTSIVQPLSSPAGQHLQYKGKLTHRSWPELPEEIIRHITTFYLYDLACTSYCPQTWDTRKHWYSRMAYACIRDCLDLEKVVMAICPQWRRAIEGHLFWTQVLHVIDPNDHLIYHSVIHPNPQHNASSNTISGPIYLTPYQHLKNIMKCTCVICRINHPTTNHGLAMSKRLAMTPFFGLVPLCKEHDKNRTTYCGLCLRDAAPFAKADSTARDFEIQQTLGIVENEDEETWPGIEMTCRKCRTEWLWRRASQSARDRDAVGGPSFQCPDWEARQNIDNFLELAEGCIADVLMLAREKLWLRMNTNYVDLGSQLLASQKNEQRYNAQEEEEEDSEEDRDAAFMSGSAQVKEMALGHWARRRILDGHWLSPADIWYNHRVLGQPLVVRTTHPCPWARDFDNVDPEGAEAQEHPLRSTIAAEIPPSFQLCEQAYLQHIKSIREVLGPPMKNLVRKLIMECHVPTARGFADPAQLARKMSLEDVIRVLREEEGVWYDGVDWIERRRNQEEEETARQQAKDEAAMMVVDDAPRPKEDDSDSMTSSSGSSVSGKSSSRTPSDSTSPVLSTSTLQTTPSPPPLSSDEGAEPMKTEKMAVERQEKMLASGPRFIPFDPVKSPPRLLGTIPYIPATIAHLPNYSLDAIRTAWREACAPLYHCSCSICERAKVADMNARAAAYAANAPVPIIPSQPVQQVLRTTIYPPAVVRQTHVDTAEIQLKEVSEVDLDGDGEEEVDYEASDLEYETDEDDDEDIEEDPQYDQSGEYQYSLSPEPEPVPQRPRKRSSDELEEPLADELDSDAASRRPPGGTPPKRARLGDRPPLANDLEDYAIDAPVALQPALVLQPAPARLRKRSSEEQDEGQAHEPPSPHKRAKVATRADSGRYGGDGEVDAYSRRRNDDLEDRPYMPPKGVGERPRRLVSKSDMDSLIALEDVDE